MRYNKNSNSREISGELVLHFDSDKLPDEIRLDYLLLKVNQYVPIPPLCNNCYAVGTHITTDCKLPPTCGNCAKPKHTTDEQPKCKEIPFCRNCEGEHPAWYTDCRERVYLKEAFYIKETQQVSLTRAKAIIDQRVKKSAKNRVLFEEKQQQPCNTGSYDNILQLVQQSNEVWESRFQDLSAMVQSVIEKLHMLTTSLSRMISSNIRGATVSPNIAGATMLSDASIDYVDHMSNFEPQSASPECEFGSETEMDLSEFNLKGGEANKLKQKMNEELAQRMKIAKEKAKAKGQAARKKK